MSIKDKERPRRTEYRVLDTRVLAVAMEGYANDWAAYIGVVRGDCHEREWEDVAQHGSKLWKALAEHLFPNFKDLQYR